MASDIRDGLRSFPLLYELLAVHVLVFFVVVALTPIDQLFPNHADVVLYFQVAERIVQGQVPYAEFALEYPPAALIPIVLPYLSWPVQPLTFETYQWLFLAQSALISVLVAATVAWIGFRQAAANAMVLGVSRYILVATAIAPIMAWRFDLFPAALAIAGVASAIGGRPAFAGALLGVGMAAKVFPVVLMPVLGLLYLATRQWQAMGRLVAGFVVAASAAWLPIVALAPGEAFSFVQWQQERPIQIESIQGGFHLLLGMLFDTGVGIIQNFGSVNVLFPGTDQGLGQQSVMVVGALLVVLALVYLRFRRDAARGGPEPGTIVAAAAAVLLALLVTNKVFSPQYMIWLVPFAALLTRGQAYLMAVAALVTSVIFPLNYEQLIAQEPWPIVLVNIRNGLIVALFAWVVVRWFVPWVDVAGLRIGRTRSVDSDAEPARS